VTLRVPAGRLEELLAAANQAGEVTEQNIRVQDVTANYVDLKIRIDNLQRLRKRLQELVEAGSTVQEILEVEKELARVTRELEQLEGQMRVLENQVSYATLTVYFQNDISPGPIGWVFYGAYSAVKWLFVWD
jgi:predicted  nucleic acid-binding Zn-ribbon protein